MVNIEMVATASLALLSANDPARALVISAGRLLVAPSARWRRLRRAGVASGGGGVAVRALASYESGISDGRRR